MANAKISQLPAVTSAAGADLGVVVQGGTTSQVSVDNLFKNRTLVAPALGTPASGTLTNCTGLPVSTGVAGLGTNVATALAENVGDTGAVVVMDGDLGTPSAGDLTNCANLPLSTGVDGLGTGVASALAENVGTTGSVQLFIAASKANLEDIANGINTTGKFAGKQVWSSTDNVPVWAAGSTAGAVWIDGSGATVYTPV